VSVVANVAINVDSSKAVQQLKQVDAAAKGLDGGLQKASVGAAGLGAALKSALAPLIATTTAIELFRRTTSAAFERSQAETRLKALTSAYGENKEAAALATAASDKFGLTQTEATKAFGDAYGRLRPLGFSLKEISGVYDGFNVVSKKAALSSAESASVFTQLSQALGSGTLRGDEFNRMAESMPEILTLVSKELGVAQGDLRKMAENGQITADVVVSALQKVAKESGNLEGFLDPSTKAMNSLAKNSEEALVQVGKLFAPAALAGMGLLADAMGFVAKNFKQITQAATFLGTFALVINGAAIATKAWAAATFVLAAAKKAAGVAAAFLQAVMNPAGLALVAAALGTATLAAVGLGKAMGESGSQAEEAKTKQKSMGPVLEEQKEKQKAIDAAIKQQTSSLQAQSQSYTVIRGQLEGQIAALERGFSVTSARYSAEKALLDLTGQQLEREYSLANTAQKRFDIAIRIFQNAVAIARVEALQALEQIKLDQAKIDNQIELQKLKIYEIKAEGELQILKSKDAQAANEKRKQLDAALAAQNLVVKSTYEQAQTQKLISGYQETVIKAQYEGKVLAAQTALETRLVSKEIGLSQSYAVQLSSNLASGAKSTGSLSSATAQVATNAASSASMFIRVATSAEAAANSIRNAANQQARLNFLRGQQPSGTAPAPQRAAQGAYWQGGFQAFASGGVVTRPTMGLIGEGGESEYIVPESKAAGFVSNYLSGARGANAIPDGKVSGAAPSVNITTGPVIEFNGERYVTMRDMENGLRQMAASIYGGLRTPAGRYAVGTR
jgi:tape measure domain-containing protein